MSEGPRQAEQLFPFHVSVYAYKCFLKSGIFCLGHRTIMTRNECENKHFVYLSIGNCTA